MTLRPSLQTLRVTALLLAPTLLLLPAGCGPKDSPSTARRTAPRAQDERPYVAPSQRGVASLDLREGKRLIRAAQWPQALAWFDRAAKTHPKDSRPLFYRGVCLYNLKRVGPALAAYRGASKLRPQFFELWNNYGTVLLVTGHSKAAVRALGNAVRIQPRSADGWLNLGLAYREARDLPAATRAFGKAADLAPRRFTHQLAYADSLRMLHRYRAAVSVYQRAVRLRPKDVSTRLGLAVSQARAGQRAAAAKSLAEVLRLRPASLQIRKAVGLVHYLMKDFVAAEQVFSALVRKAPTRADYLLLHGRVLLKLGRSAAALKVLAKARRLAKPATARARRQLKHLEFYLAEAYRLRRRCRKAKPLYRSYLAKVPAGVLAKEAKEHLKRCPK